MYCHFWDSHCGQRRRTTLNFTMQTIAIGVIGVRTEHGPRTTEPHSTDDSVSQSQGLRLSLDRAAAGRDRLGRVELESETAGESGP